MPVELAVTAALNGLGDDSHDARLELLEAIACQLAGLDLDDFRALGGVTTTHRTAALIAAAPAIVAALNATPVPPALALTALAREPLPHSERRKAGSYYTDFRLARYVAERTIELQPLQPSDLVIDPASGTGILLAALALAAFGDDRKALDDFVSRSVCAADVSPTALRAVRLALTSLAGSIASVEALTERLRGGDSLLAGTSAWTDVAPSGFDLVIGNPPWEKLKISRHEHLSALGALRHYGDDYHPHHELDTLADARSALADYVRSVECELSGKGEPDLYRLFLALSSALVKPGGGIAILVPAGLIRSESTHVLRAYLTSTASDLRIAILDNKARFFSIDTRFKFLALNALIDPTGKPAPLVLEHAAGNDTGVLRTGHARIDRGELVAIRPDLSVPEVRSDAEWQLFRRLSAEGDLLSDPEGPWQLRFSREVDMTNDRHMFERAKTNGQIPLIEGRMVHQFRYAAKAYLSGTGRRANWAWQMPGEAELRPQFFVDPKALPDAVRERAGRQRIGFCDITGQTNERSMLASTIPAGVTCGNKVPTITFDTAHDEELVAGVFLAVVNSFAFDWLLRRVLTTTVNYFLLLSVPFPRLDLDGELARRLADLARFVEAAYEDGIAEEGIWALRAALDALVMRAYGLRIEEAELVLADFPLLDRGQPPLPNERRSTITRDLVLAELGQLIGGSDPTIGARVAAALDAGAEPYVPSQMAKQKAAVPA
jgi:methylase of polypeptide subunit release factors